MSPLYQYEARNQSGEKVTGSLEVDRSVLVVKELKKRGYYLTSLRQEKAKKNIEDILFLKKRVKIKDLVFFSQQFASLINAGLGVVDALNIIGRQADNHLFKGIITRLQEGVETGSSLSEMMELYPEVFPQFYYQSVRAGETGGVLDIVLGQLVEHYERREEIQNRIKTALYYPLTVLVVSVVVVLFLMVGVVPRFVNIFDSMGALLPLPTRVLLFSSQIMKQYWWAIMLIMAGGLLAIYFYWRTSRGRYHLDSILLKLPVFGTMVQKITIARLSGTLSILLESGIDLLSALKVVEGLLSNQVFVRILEKAGRRVREGLPLSRPLSGYPEMPLMVVQMIRVGEEAGTLPGMLEKINCFYQREVGDSVDAALSLIEPVLIVVLALLVGFIVFSIALPMFSMVRYY